jgi:DNA-binding NarL/FixJ family response regulator
MTLAAEQFSAANDPRPSLLIADDDQVVRSVLSVQLEPDFRLIGVASDATEAIQLAEVHRPDAALIDVDMPGGGARRALARITTSSPNTRVVILSGDERHDVVVDLLTAGAITYIHKGISAPELVATITRALQLPDIPPIQ